MNRRSRILAFVFCAFLGLLLTASTAKAQTQQVSIGVSVVERKSTDTLNDFDFSYNSGSAKAVLGQMEVKRRVTFITKVFDGIYKTIKSVL